MAEREYMSVTRMEVDKIEAEEIEVSGDQSVTGTLTVGGLRLSDTSFEDLKFSATAVDIDKNSTRYRFDATNMGIVFDDDARYTEEQVSMIGQMPHAAKAEAAIHPHIHWIQDHETTLPNWLLGYRITNNGAAPGSFTLLTPESHIFTYTSGDLLQISSFGDIAMTGATISCILEFKLWNDTANTSTEFAGAVAKAALFKEFDVHYEIDSFGSNEEFVKGT